MAKHVLRLSDSAKRVRPPGSARNNGYILPPEKLEQREAAFVVYRDMGKGRRLTALERELKQHHLRSPRRGRRSRSGRWRISGLSASTSTTSLHKPPARRRRCLMASSTRSPS